MISDTEFHMVQDILKENNENRIGKLDLTDEFHLAKTLRCCGCNKLLSGCYSKGKTKYYGYYQCGNVDCSARQYLSKDKVESNFIELLSKITPTNEDLELFEEIVVDAYTKNYKDVLLIHKQKEKELEKFKKQLNKLKELVENEIYTIDEYHERKLAIEANIATSKVELSETNIEVCELETCINYVKMYIENLPKFWIMLSIKDKIKLNCIVFPNGLNYENGAYRTPQLHSIYREIRAISHDESNELTPRGIEPRLQD